MLNLTKGQYGKGDVTLINMKATESDIIYWVSWIKSFEDAPCGSLERKQRADWWNIDAAWPTFIFLQVKYSTVDTYVGILYK